jgi:hypothetical protein
MSKADRPSLMGSTDLVMSHELGHAFGLCDNSIPTNLMCVIDPPPTGFFILDVIEGAAAAMVNNAVCGPPIEHRTLTDRQLRDTDGQSANGQDRVT